jgi:hypothetical protein
VARGSARARLVRCAVRRMWAPGAAWDSPSWYRKEKKKKKRKKKKEKKKEAPRVVETLTRRILLILMMGGSAIVSSAPELQSLEIIMTGTTLSRLNGISVFYLYKHY